MKFKTADIIARIDQKIVDRVTDAERRTREAAAQAATAREEWLSQSEHWVVFADRIKDKIWKGRPIVESDIPKEITDRYTWNRLDCYRSGKPRTFTADTSDLDAMKAALSAVTDQEISTAGLKELGLSNLRDLFS